MLRFYSPDPSRYSLRPHQGRPVQARNPRNNHKSKCLCSSWPTKLRMSSPTMGPTRSTQTTSFASRNYNKKLQFEKRGTIDRRPWPALRPKAFTLLKAFENFAALIKAFRTNTASRRSVATFSPKRHQAQRDPLQGDTLALH